MKTKIHMPMGMYSAFKQPYSIYMRRARCVFGLLNTADGEKTRWFGIALRVPAIEVGSMTANCGNLGEWHVHTLMSDYRNMLRSPPSPGIKTTSPFNSSRARNKNLDVKFRVLD